MIQNIKEIKSLVFKSLSALIIVVLFIYLLFPFFSAILMGGILSLALSQVVSWLKAKGLSTKTSLNILLAATFFIFLAPSLAFLIRGSGLLTRTINDPSAVEKFNLIFAQAVRYIEKLTSTLGLGTEDIHNYTNQIIQKVSAFTLQIFSQILSEVPSLILFSIILLISIYFFLFNEDRIKHLFNKHFYFKPKNAEQFINTLQSCVRDVFVSNVLTGFIQAFIVTLGAAIFQFSEWFLIFFITFICSFIPVVGAGPVAFVLAVFSFANGSVGPGIGMLVISFITGTADNFIRLYLVSRGSVEVPALIGFLAVIGGVITMGLPGLFLGPLVAALAFGILPILMNELLQDGNQ